MVGSSSVSLSTQKKQKTRVSNRNYIKKQKRLHRKKILRSLKIQFKLSQQQEPNQTLNKTAKCFRFCSLKNRRSRNCLEDNKRFNSSSSSEISYIKSTLNKADSSLSRIRCHKKMLQITATAVRKFVLLQISHDILIDAEYNLVQSITKRAKNKYSYLKSNFYCYPRRLCL